MEGNSCFPKRLTCKEAISLLKAGVEVARGTPVLPALKRLRQGNHCRFEVNLEFQYNSSCRMTPCHQNKWINQSDQPKEQKQHLTGSKTTKSVTSRRTEKLGAALRFSALGWKCRGQQGHQVTIHLSSGTDTHNKELTSPDSPRALNASVLKLTEFTWKWNGAPH